MKTREFSFFKIIQFNTVTPFLLNVTKTDLFIFFIFVLFF